MILFETCVSTYIDRLNSVAPRSSKSKASQKSLKQSAAAYCFKFLEVHNNYLELAEVSNKQTDSINGIVNSLDKASTIITGALSENEYQSENS